MQLRIQLCSRRNLIYNALVSSRRLPLLFLPIIQNRVPCLILPEIPFRFRFRVFGLGLFPLFRGFFCPGGFPFQLLFPGFGPLVGRSAL